jgi:ribonuclease R
MNSNKQKKKQDLEEVLAVLRDHKGRALHVMEVSARLGIEGERRDEIRIALETLEEEGRVQQLPGLRFRALKAREVRGLPKSAPEERSAARRPAPTAKLGTLRIHARGHGFVSCEDNGGDVFVAPPDLMGSLHGDRVAVSVRRGERGLEGVVVAVLGRSLKYVVGPILHLEQGLVIQSQDARLPQQVNVVGNVPGDAVPGLAVVAEIVRFREDGGPPDARVVRVLGVEGSAEVEVAKIKLREGILEEFPEQVLFEARAFGDRVSNKDKRDREDLRDLDLVTIDPITARDHDDAIFIERGEQGGYHVVVAIADVSHYVQEGSALDTEAIARSTSIYLPDRAIPMLPPELSVNLASLVAGKDRLTLAIDMELSSSGQVRSFRYVEGLMRCKAGLTYEGVAQALGMSQDGPKDRTAQRYLPMLEVLHECAMVLRKQRMKRGSLDFDLPEPYVHLNPQSGEPSKVERSRKDPGVRRAYQLVEEMMLLANETVAADLAQRKLPAIYRVHGMPDMDRLEQFAGLAQALGYRLAPEEATSPRQLSRFLASLDDSPHKSALSYLLLRSMQQASYDTVNVGHFGLAAEHYLHFTSPIRRYPDLAVHRVVRRLARGEPIDAVGLERKLRDQAGNASKLERRAMQVEREVIDVYRCILVKERVGDEFEATVSGVAPHGIYCAFDDPFVEALCHVTALGNDFYELDKHGLRLVGRRSGAGYGLGDRLTVRLESVNVTERAILAAPVIYVHPDELPTRGIDPVHEGGLDRLKRRERAKANDSRSDTPKANESWGKHHAKKKPGRVAAPAREEQKRERKMERRAERRSKDDRKQKPRRR